MHVYSSFCKWLKKGKLHSFIGYKWKDFIHLHPLYTVKWRVFTHIWTIDAFITVFQSVICYSYIK